MNKSFQKIKAFIAYTLIASWLGSEIAPFQAGEFGQPKHLSPFSAFSLLVGSAEVDPELPALIESTRGLAFSQQAEELDQALFSYAKRTGKRYLRLTVRDREDFDRLRSPLALIQGKLIKRNSPLYDVVFNGGILFLDYAHSDPKFVEEFNSVFDRIARFEGREVSPDLIVVGAIDPNHFSRHPTSFYSRYKAVQNKNFKEKDPLAQITPPPTETSGRKTILRGSSRFLDILVGKYFFSPAGELKFGKSSFTAAGELNVEEGDLVAAMRAGEPLVLQNAPWENERFRHFLRQIYIQGGLDANGEWISLEKAAAKGFRLYRESVDENQGVEQKQVIPTGESKGFNWILNKETVDLLFAIPHVNENHQMTEIPGLLFRPGETTRLRVTEPLPEEFWHQIFHAAGPIIIEVADPDWIPSVYRKSIREDFKTRVEPKPAVSWEEAQNQKAFLVEAEDLSVVQQMVKDNWVYPITPETGLADLTVSLEVRPSADNSEGHQFVSEPKSNGVLQALQQGKTVILEGVHRNPALLKQLESLFAPEPYWMVNGEAVPLSRYPGKLILTSKGRMTGSVVVTREENDQHLREILYSEFGSRFSNESEFDEILDVLFELRNLFEKIHASSDKKVIPRSFSFTLDKLRMLFEYSNKIEGFDEIFLSPYRNEPEIYAYLRVEMRKILGGYLKKHSKDHLELQKPTSLHGGKVQELKKKGITPSDIASNFWQWVDTLSLDLLESVDIPLEDPSAFGLRMTNQLKVGSGDENSKKEKICQQIQGALLRHSSGIKQEVLKKLYGMTVEDTSDWSLDETVNDVIPSWEEERAEALFVLEKFRVAFFKGLPGVGKSYICDHLGKDLGYSSDEIYSIVSGADIQEADVVSRHVYNAEERRSDSEDQAVARWAKNKNGGLLVWDEANLTKEEFAQFLSGLNAPQPYIWIEGERILLTPRHRVIFTGNPENLKGRRYQSLIQEKVITLNFFPFSDKFLKKQIKKYLPPTLHNSHELLELVLELHRYFEKARPELGYSLREIQELTSRIRIAGNERDWDRDGVVNLAWQLYSGLLDLEEAEAMRALLENRYGNGFIKVEIDKINDIVKWVTEEKSEHYPGIGWAPGALKTVKEVRDFLRIRKARQEREDKRSLLGKWAMILEGGSGLGKDDLVEMTFKAEELRDTQDYLIWNASPHKIAELKKILEEAAREGKVVVVSEANLISSSVLEGMLNTLLTEQGDYKTGFAVVMTINSVDFQGREAFSTAFKSRTVSDRVYDHSRAGLWKIAQTVLLSPSNSVILSPNAVRAKDLPFETLINILIGCNLWIRNRVNGPHQRPTLREFIRALDKIKKEEPIEQILREVYGPIYFENILKGQKLPSVEECLREPENDPIDWKKSYRTAAEILLESKEAAASFEFTFSDEEGNPTPDSILQTKLKLSGKKGSSESWTSLIEALARHRFHIPHPDWTVSSSDATYPLYLALEHYRLLEAMKKFRHIDATAPLFNPQAQCLEAIRQMDLNYFIKASEKDLFVSLLVLEALGKIGDAQAELTALLEAAEKPELLQKVRQALPLAEKFLGSLPSSDGQEEILVAQFAAFQSLAELRKIFESCSSEVPTPNAFEVEEKETQPVSRPRNPEEMQARIREQQQKRLEAEKKALLAEIDAVEKAWQQPLSQYSLRYWEGVQAKIPVLERRAAALQIKSLKRLESLKEQLERRIEVKKLDEEINLMASRIVYGAHEKPLQELLDEAMKNEGLFGRVAQLPDDLPEKQYLSDKVRKLRLLMEGWIAREKAENAGTPIPEGKISPDQWLGHDFSLTAQRSRQGRKPTGPQKIESYAGDYLEGETPEVEVRDFFTPHVDPHMRTEILSQVEGTTLKENKNKTFQEVSIEGGSKIEWEEKGFQVFDAEMEVELEPGKKVPIASVGDEQHFFAVKPIEGLHFFKDSDDLYYVESTKTQGKVTLRFSVAIPNRYFGMAISEDVEIDPKRKPQNLSEDILWALDQFKLKPGETNVRKILRFLARTISSYSDKPIPVEKRSGNIFRDTLLHKSGACRQRTQIFVVLAQALGLQARYVRNSYGAHAYPEVYIPKQGWIRVTELGGGDVILLNQLQGPKHEAPIKIRLAENEEIRSQGRFPPRQWSTISRITFPRDPNMQELTARNKEKVRQLLRVCFYEALKEAGGREATQNGSHLSVQQLFRDPSRPYLSVVPQIALYPKRLILKGPLGKKGWNPFLSELFHTFLEEGTQIAIYDGEEREPYPVKSVDELVLFLEEAPKVKHADVRRYIERECNPETTLFVDLEELQEKIEALYLDGILNMILDLPETPVLEGTGPASNERIKRVIARLREVATEYSPKEKDLSYSWIEQTSDQDWVQVDPSEKGKPILGISRNGLYYAKRTEDGSFAVFDSKTGEKKWGNALYASSEPNDKFQVRWCHVSDEGKFMVVGGSELVYVISENNLIPFPKVEPAKYEGLDLDEKNKRIYALIGKEGVSGRLLKYWEYIVQGEEVSINFSEPHQSVLDEPPSSPIDWIRIFPETNSLMFGIKSDKYLYHFDTGSNIWVFSVKSDMPIAFWKSGYYGMYQVVSQTVVTYNPLDGNFPKHYFLNTKLPGESPSHLEISPDGKYLAAVYWGGNGFDQLYFIQLGENPKVFKSMTFATPVEKIQFLPGGKGIEVKDGMGRTLRLERPETADSKAKETALTAAEYLKNLSMIIKLGEKREVRLIEEQKTKGLKPILFPLNENHHLELKVSEGMPATLELVESKTGRILDSFSYLRLHSEALFTSRNQFAFYDEGNDSIDFYRTEGEMLRAAGLIHLDGGTVLNMAFSKNGKRAAALIELGGKIQLVIYEWNSNGGYFDDTAATFLEVSPDEAIDDLAWNEEGTFLACFGSRETLVCYQFSKEEPIDDFNMKQDPKKVKLPPLLHPHEGGNLFVVQDIEKKEERLLVIGKNGIHHAPLSKILDGSLDSLCHEDQNLLSSYSLDINRILVPSGIKKVAVDPENGVVAVLDKAGKMVLHPIKNAMSFLIRYQDLEQPSENLGEVDAELTFSPDGKTVRCETKDKIYTWSFVNQKEDFFWNKIEFNPNDFKIKIEEALNPKARQKHLMTLLRSLVGSLVSPEETMKKVHASMTERGRGEAAEKILAKIERKPDKIIEQSSVLTEFAKKFPFKKEEIGSQFRAQKQVETAL